MDATSEATISRAFHDLRNTLGAVLLNLEVAADPEGDSGMRGEAAADALKEAQSLQAGLERLRAVARRLGA